MNSLRRSRGNRIYANFGALEANERIANVEDEPMKVQLITDKFIDFNGIKKVDNPIMFERGLVPTSGGLFSEYIFGVTNEEKMRKYGYIDLGTKFIHPFVYTILKKLYRNVEKICNGEGSWFIDDTGDLIEIKSEDDSRYDIDATGMSWFIENYSKIKFKENESIGRKDRIKFIKSLTPDEMFITKWIVIPVFYRDVDISNGRPDIPEINKEYNNLIRYTNMISKSNIFGFINNKTMFNILMTMVRIAKFGQTLIEKKKGAFRQTVLGKSIDYGARAVISAPVMAGIELPKDNPVDIYHSGIPLAQCISLGFPFMLKWVEDFFRKEFEDTPRKVVAVYNKDTKEYEYVEADIKDQLVIYTTERIKKEMRAYMNTYGARFKPIMIHMADGTEKTMSFTGRPYSRHRDDPGASEISKRPMTWTDLFYIAAMQTLSDKHMYITRYPMIDYTGMFPSLCRPISTIKTMPVQIEGEVYEHYPVIDLSLTEDQISTQFIDTAQISNLYLKALGGDYDGDMVSIKMLYTMEANREAAEMMRSLKHFVGIEGSIMRNISNEAALMWYCMTTV